MMQTNRIMINEELNKIKSLVHHNIFEASDLLLKLVRNYSFDSDILRNIILIKSDLNNELDQNSENTSIYIEKLLDICRHLEKVQDSKKINVEQLIEQNIKLSTRYDYLKPRSEFAVQTRGICFQYKKGRNQFNLKDIFLNLKYGEITAVIGENGNGKSTLLKLIAARLLPDGGEIAYDLLDKKKYSHKDNVEIRKRIAYIPQRLPVWDGLVKTNLQFIAAIKGLKGKENIEETDYIINRLSLNKYQDYKWPELSGGFQMRYELANALVWHPKLLILDEPLANLDLISQSLFLKDLKDICLNIRNPMAVIISSQHLDMIDNVADNIVFLKEGKLSFNANKKSIGEDRTRNIFEIKTTLSIADLHQQLKNLGVEKIINIGFNTVIYANTNTTLADIINQLTLIENVEITMARDISQSSKALLYQSYEY